MVMDDGYGWISDGLCEFNALGPQGPTHQNQKQSYRWTKGIQSNTLESLLSRG